MWHGVKRGQYRSWGPLAAASGFVAFTFNHRYHAPELLPQSVGDVAAAIAYVREHAAAFSLDLDRLCLWTCSGGGLRITFALRDQPAYVRCLVIYYAVLDLRPVDFLVKALGEESCQQYSPLTAIEAGPVSFPIFITVPVKRRNASFPFRYPMNWNTAYFGGIETTRCTWST